MNKEESGKDIETAEKEESSRRPAEQECCYVVEPCGCYVDPCGCYVDPCSCGPSYVCCR